MLISDLDSCLIGVVGVGIMGEGILTRLHNQGYSVVGFTRNTEKLASKNINKLIIPDISLLISRCDLIFLTLTNYNVINSAFIHYINDISLKNKTVFQMGTISPCESKILERAIIAKGGSYLETPVQGSAPEAHSGMLAMICGGDENVFNLNRVLLKVLAKHIHFVGTVSQASVVKLCLNFLVTAMTSSIATALDCSAASGIGHDKFMEIVRTTALYAETFDKKLIRYKQMNFDHPNFPLEHLLKDLILFIALLKNNNMKSDLTATLLKIVEEGISMGCTRNDYSVIYKILSERHYID